MTRGPDTTSLSLIFLSSLRLVDVGRVSRLHVREEEAGGSAVRVLVQLLHAAVTLVRLETRRGRTTARVGRDKAAAIDVVLARKVRDGSASVAAKLSAAARTEGSRAERAGPTQSPAGR